MSVLGILYRRYGRRHLKAMILLAVISNLMIVAPSLHMLQVYNRVLSSYSLETLITLTAIVLLALAVYGVCEALRGRVAVRLSNAYCVAVSERLFDGFARHDVSPTKSAQNLRDFGTVRGYLAGRGVPSLFDLPFVPFFLLILFVVHWSVGVLTLIGAAALAGLSLLNSRASEHPQTESRKAEAEVNAVAQSTLSRGEDVAALGLAPNLKRWWMKRLARALTLADETGQGASTYYAASRAIRQMLQVLLMAWAAFLVIHGDISGGLIFLVSMISSKALAPIEQLIGGWDGLAKAKTAFLALEEQLGDDEAAQERPALPSPQGRLEVEGLVIEGDHFEKTGKALIEDVSLTARPGELIAIVGVSGSGKSVLARAIAGAIPATRGMIRLDGAARGQWPAAQWGRAIGYVAQETNLLPGTIAANIARFEQNVPAEAIYAAAMAAGVHETILELPDGYMTPIADGAAKLSSGQRKAIALARAFYGDPKILVLDQPTLNLDQLAETKFVESLAAAKRRGMTIIAISQRGSIMQMADRCYVMQAGKMRVLPSPAREASRHRVPAPVAAAPVAAAPTAAAVAAQVDATSPPVTRIPAEILAAIAAGRLSSDQPAAPPPVAAPVAATEPARQVDAQKVQTQEARTQVVRTQVVRTQDSAVQEAPVQRVEARAETAAPSEAGAGVEPAHALDADAGERERAAQIEAARLRAALIETARQQAAQIEAARARPDASAFPAAGSAAPFESAAEALKASGLSLDEEDDLERAFRTLTEKSVTRLKRRANASRPSGGPA